MYGSVSRFRFSSSINSLCLASCAGVGSSSSALLIAANFRAIVAQSTSAFILSVTQGRAFLLIAGICVLISLQVADPVGLQLRDCGVMLVEVHFKLVFGLFAYLLFMWRAALIRSTLTLFAYVVLVRGVSWCKTFIEVSRALVAS